MSRLRNIASEVKAGRPRVIDLGSSTPGAVTSEEERSVRSWTDVVSYEVMSQVERDVLEGMC